MLASFHSQLVQLTTLDYGGSQTKKIILGHIISVKELRLYISITPILSLSYLILLRLPQFSLMQPIR